MSPKEIQNHFEDFYEDLFEELSQHGHIESLNVCDNLADHMVCLHLWPPLALYHDAFGNQNELHNSMCY